MYFLGFSKYTKRVSSLLENQRHSEVEGVPCDSLLFVGVSVLETLYLTSLSSEQAVQAIISYYSNSHASPSNQNDGTSAISLGGEGSYFGPTLFPPEGSVVWH